MRLINLFRKHDNEEKIRVTIGVVQRVQMIRYELGKLTRASDLVAKNVSQLKISHPTATNSSLEYEDIIITDKLVRERFRAVLDERISELQSMLNQILIDEYENNHGRDEEDARCSATCGSH